MKVYVATICHTVVMVALVVAGVVTSDKELLVGALAWAAGAGAQKGLGR